MFVTHLDDLEPELRLAAAILHRAVLDVVRNTVATETRAEAYLWLHSAEAGHIAAVLGGERLLRRLLQRLDELRLPKGVRGENHGRAKLTEQQVKEIKHALQNRTSVRHLAQQYGVSRRTIEFIASGRTWKHVPWPETNDRRLTKKLQR